MQRIPEFLQILCRAGARVLQRITIKQRQDLLQSSHKFEDLSAHLGSQICVHIVGANLVSNYRVAALVPLRCRDRLISCRNQGTQGKRNGEASSPYSKAQKVHRAR